METNRKLQKQVKHNKCKLLYYIMPYYSILYYIILYYTILYYTITGQRLITAVAKVLAASRLNSHATAAPHPSGSSGYACSHPVCEQSLAQVALLILVPMHVCEHADMFKCCSPI